MSTLSDGGGRLLLFSRSPPAAATSTASSSSPSSPFLAPAAAAAAAAEPRGSPAVLPPSGRNRHRSPAPPPASFAPPASATSATPPAAAAVHAPLDLPATLPATPQPAGGPGHDAEIFQIQRLWTRAKGELKRLNSLADAAEARASGLEEALSQEAARRAAAEFRLAEVTRDEAEARRRARSAQEAELHTERTKRAEMEGRLERSRRDLQDKQLALEEARVQSEIRDAELGRLSEAQIKLGRDTSAAYATEERCRDLQRGLADALQRIEQQGTALQEARAQHAEVLAQIAALENDVIRLRSEGQEAASASEAYRDQADTNAARVVAAEAEAERVVQWARDAEARANHQVEELQLRMNEVQLEAARMLALHTHTQRSLVEMRGELGEAAKREGRHRAKIKSMQTEIAHLTHRLKVRKFETMASAAVEQAAVGKPRRGEAAPGGGIGGIGVVGGGVIHALPTAGSVAEMAAAAAAATSPTSPTSPSRSSPSRSGPSTSSTSSSMPRGERAIRESRSNGDSAQQDVAALMTSGYDRITNDSHKRYDPAWLDDTSRFIKRTKDLLAVSRKMV